MKSLAPATSDIRLADIDPNATGTGRMKKSARKSAKAAGEAALAAGNLELSELQEKLYAESRAGGRRSVLVVLQGMDTSGKGGIVHHAFGGANPAGLSAHSFGAPTDEEKAHDFLWRVHRKLPGAGIIGVFDRSHYEDVLIHRVRGLSAPDIVEARYGKILDFERDAAERGITIIKVMLHISLDEQKERLLARLDRPEKHWKFSPDDLTERTFWDEYQEAYEIAIARTATDHAPWYVVPANHKWYARLAVQTIVLEKLRELNLEWPIASFDVEAAREKLLGN
jgi:PPK2 family polyphosphate:nucleotide phosphotransferase